jgi:hypothetical protein
MCPVKLRERYLPILKNPTPDGVLIFRQAVKRYKNNNPNWRDTQPIPTTR